MRRQPQPELSQTIAMGITLLMRFLLFYSCRLHGDDEDKDALAHRQFALSTGLLSLSVGLPDVGQDAQSLLQAYEKCLQQLDASMPGSRCYSGDY